MTTFIASCTKTQLQDLRSVKREWSAKYLTASRSPGFRAFATAASSAPNQNVVGVGIGEKFEGDRPTGVLAVKFFVRRKYTEAELSSRDLLPKQIDGLPVDVEQSGLFRAFIQTAKKKKPKPQAGPIPNPKT